MIEVVTSDDSANASPVIDSGGNPLFALRRSSVGSVPSPAAKPASLPASPRMAPLELPATAATPAVALRTSSTWGVPFFFVASTPPALRACKSDLPCSA